MEGGKIEFLKRQKVGKILNSLILFISGNKRGEFENGRRNVFNSDNTKRKVFILGGTKKSIQNLWYQKERNLN